MEEIFEEKERKLKNKGIMSAFGLLKDKNIDAQKIKDEIREEEIISERRKYKDC